MTQAELAGVAAEAKLSKWTAQKIRIGQIKNPGVDKVQALYNVLKLREIRRRRAA
jgi:hypothetical protein